MKPVHQTVYDGMPGLRDPVKKAAYDPRSLAALTHIAREGINALKARNKLPEGGPPLEYGLEYSEPRTYPPSWA